MHEKNYDNEERKVGFEIEYTELSLKKAAQIIQKIFGGNIIQNENATMEVIETKFGNFTLELDAIPLQKLLKSTKEFEIEEKFKQPKIAKIKSQLAQAIENAGAKIVPYEIVSPPIPIHQISQISDLCIALRDEEAKGTKASFRYAFGLHINPEVESLEADYIISHLQSFLLLQTWLKKKHKIDIARRITNFIDPFPKAYLTLILDKNYNPNFKQLAKDYHKYNPTRNRALDMLPLFAFIDENLIRNLYGEEEKINKRPTFHYRLPNSEISNGEWSIKKEWNIWLNVENLANNKNILNSAIEAWKEYNDKIISTEKEWLEIISNIIGKLND